jgi:hypothetical protein
MCFRVIITGLPVWAVGRPFAAVISCMVAVWVRLFLLFVAGTIMLMTVVVPGLRLLWLLMIFLSPACTMAHTLCQC